MRKSVFEWIWEKITRYLNPRWQCLNPTWQNSRWLISSSWVRINEFESDWTSLSRSFVQYGWIQDGRIQDGCHHQVSQIELVWVRVRVDGEGFWVNLREDDRVSYPRWQCLNPTWQNSRWLISSSLVRINEFESDWTSLSQSFVQNGWIQDGRIQDGRIEDGCHHQVSQIELVWVRVRVEGECFWVNLREDDRVS